MKHQFHSEFWSELPWKKFRRNLHRLQIRVWKAIRAGDTERTKSLQKLILRSRCAQFMAIRQVTQLNQGKKTAGIDGKLALEIHERFELQQRLAAHVFTWRHQKLRVIPIPKKDGTKRLLKVPSISDRAWQCLVKYAVEPAHEATFHANSYGFRPGRGTWDAQKAIYLKLRGTMGLNKTILELDVEKCFDRIDHSFLLSNIICPQKIREGLLRCLKAGTPPEFPNQGAQQGGIVSPLLANIALNGIEDISPHFYKGPNGQKSYTCIRYADDAVFILYPEHDPQEVLSEVEKFLKVRGLKVKESKTHIVSPTDGFNFLGWNFQVKPLGKCVVRPSEDNYKSFRQKVKRIVNSSNIRVEDKVERIAPIVRGWRNYHRFCDMSGSRFSLWFLNHAAFRKFLKLPSVDRHKARELAKRAFPYVPYKQGHHPKVKGEASPFDGELVYWSKRKSKLYAGPTSQALQNQRHTCGYCGLKFADDERIHLHHINGDSQQWNASNLLAVHESCHDYAHMRKAQGWQLMPAQSR